jgi:hypothetical protein
MVLRRDYKQSPNTIRAIFHYYIYIYTPSGAIKEVILRVTERAQKEVIVRVGLGFGRCCP